jgi:hypothetical protein
MLSNSAKGGTCSGESSTLGVMRLATPCDPTSLQPKSPHRTPSTKARTARNVIEQCEGGDLNPPRTARTSKKIASSNTRRHRPSCQVVHQGARTCVRQDDCGTIRTPLVPASRPGTGIASRCPEVRSPGWSSLRSLARSRRRRTRAAGTSWASLRESSNGVGANEAKRARPIPFLLEDAAETGEIRLTGA